MAKKDDESGFETGGEVSKIVPGSFETDDPLEHIGHAAKTWSPKKKFPWWITLIVVLVVVLLLVLIYVLVR